MSLRNLLHLPPSAEKKTKPFLNHRGSMEQLHMRMAAASFKHNQQEKDELHDEEEYIKEADFLQSHNATANTKLEQESKSSVNKNADNVDRFSLQNVYQLLTSHDHGRASDKDPALEMQHQSMPNIVAPIDDEQKGRTNEPRKKASRSLRNVFHKSSGSEKKQPTDETFQNHRGSVEQVHFQRSIVEKQIATEADTSNRNKKGRTRMRNLLHKSRSEKTHKPFQSPSMKRSVSVNTPGSFL
mmetsp:Transcript_8953/g.14924  ORF Transcript_8953/g.14924 Transcript_8953/m.14924 type:complete len:241 (-) Transcript_8953:162-884(-)